MDARMYLEQIPRLMTQIQNKLVECAEYRQLNVDSGKLEQEVADLLDKRQEIIHVLDKVAEFDLNIYDMLHLHYVQGFNWKEVADMQGITYQWLCVLRNRAMEKLQPIIDEMGELK